MLTLHHLLIGRALFTLWLVEELEAPHELKIYHRDPATMRAPMELRAVHPLGKAPIIEDGPVTLAESGAITTWLLTRYRSDRVLVPDSSDPQLWANYLYWLHYPEGSAFLPLLMELLMMRSAARPEPFATFAAGEVPLHLDHMVEGLGDRDYLLGAQISGADFGFAYIVSLAGRLGLLGSRPTLLAYLQRVTSRPACQRAMEKTGERI